MLDEIRALSRRAVERPAELGELEITITPQRARSTLDLARRYADLGVHRLALLPRDLDSPTFAERADRWLVGEPTVIGRV